MKKEYYHVSESESKNQIFKFLKRISKLYEIFISNM